MVQNNITVRSREEYGLEKAIAIAFKHHKQGRVVEDSKEKLVLESRAVSNNIRKEIDYFKSCHSRGLQRSRYI
jgi:hypothetical protein